MQSEHLRERLRIELALARKETDQLFQMLAPDAIYDRPIPERHRVIFYLGHLEAFDWNMVCATAFGMPSFNSQFDRLFQFGIDPVGGELPQDKPSDWPSVRRSLLITTAFVARWTTYSIARHLRIRRTRLSKTG